MEQRVVQQLLEAVSGNAIEAALQAAEHERNKQGVHRRSLELGLEQARYQARLAERRYEEVDPSQRFVARELEARWNVSLERVREAEAQYAEFEQRLAASAIPSSDLLLSLAQDLPAVWNLCADMRLKQRIVHLVLREILVDVDPQTREVIMLLHWAGGRHSEVRWTKRRSGLPQKTEVTAVEIIGRMAGTFADQQIAHTLNRQRLRTALGGGWTAEYVAQIRKEHRMAEGGAGRSTMTLQQAARRVQVGIPTLRRLIARRIVPAQQVVAFGPWQIAEEALDSEPVKRALARIRRRQNRNYSDERQQHIFSDTYEGGA